MEKPRSRIGFTSIAVIALAVAIVGAGVYLYFTSQKKASDGFPLLPIVDINEKRLGGTIVRFNGGIFVRNATPEDLQRPEISPAPDGKASEWIAVTDHQAPYILGTLFHLRPKAHLELMTSGNYLTGLDGEGEFVLEDARRNEDGSVRTISWFLKRGMFRAKHHDSDRGDHWLVIRSQTAKVVLHQGEIGMDVRDGGVAGRVWLMAGQGHIYWKDGREQPLKLREMINL